MKPFSLTGRGSARCPSIQAPWGSRQGRRRVSLCALTSNDIKNRMTLVLDGDPWVVQEFLHVKPGKGSAFVRTKMKNMLSGQTVERTFRAGEPIEKADVEKVQCQYTYNEGQTYVFMNMSTYEEVRVPRDEAWAKWLQEGVNCDLQFYNGVVISVDPPKNMVVKVTETEPGVRGDTSGKVTKSATVETGAVLQVPLFVEQGMLIKVDAQEGKYIERAKEGDR